MEESNTEDSIENKVEKSQNDNQSKNQAQIAGAIILAGILIAGAILIKGNAPRTSAPSVVNTVSINMRPVSADEHILGNPNAEVVIVEYSDTECPYCKVFHNTLHGAMGQAGGRVAWVYRHYPIAQLHPKAFHEAEATECASEQGGNNAFWKYIDEVFLRTESNNRLDVAELPKIAKDIGLDVSSFNTCLASGKYATKIQADMDDGTKAGAVGTPYSVVITKKDITSKQQQEIIAVVQDPRYISFDSEKKNVMTLNGALPQNMVSGIFNILLK